jgi:hypothetical protein
LKEKEMLIQDIYAVGMRLQQVLITKGLHNTGKSPTMFRAVWTSARNIVQKEVEDGTLPLIGDHGSIDWNLHLEDK